jgi:hypothetical protein
VEELLSTNDPATAENVEATEPIQESGDKPGNPEQLTSESMTAGEPQLEFKVLEESVLNHPPDQIQLVLPSELDRGEFESLRSPPSRDPNLAAFSAVTVLLLVSLIILYQSGMAEEIQSLLKTTFG